MASMVATVALTLAVCELGRGEETYPKPISGSRPAKPRGCWVLLQKGTLVQTVSPALEVEDLLNERARDLAAAGLGGQALQAFPELPDLQGPTAAGLQEVGSSWMSALQEPLSLAQAVLASPDTPPQQGTISASQQQTQQGWTGSPDAWLGGWGQAVHASPATALQQGTISASQQQTQQGWVGSPDAWLGGWEQAEPPRPAADAPTILAQQQAAMAGATGWQAVGSGEATAALQRAADQLGRAQRELSGQRQVALIAEGRASRDEDRLHASERNLQEAKDSIAKMELQLQKLQHDGEAKDAILRAEYEKRLRDDGQRLRDSEQRSKDAEARYSAAELAQQELRQQLQWSQAQAKQIQERLEEQLVVKGREDEAKLDAARRQGEDAQKELQQRNEMLSANQQLLQRGEAQLRQASTILQASMKKIVQLESDLGMEKEVVSYMEAKAIEEAKRSNASEALRHEADLRLQVIAMQDAQRLNSSELRLQQQQQQLQIMAHQLSASEARAASHQALQERLNASLVMNRLLQLQLAQEMVEIGAKEQQLAQAQHNAKHALLMPWADILDRCGDICFTLAHGDACCGGSMQPVSQRPQNCLIAAQILRGLAAAPASCSAAPPQAAPQEWLPAAIAVQQPLAAAVDPTAGAAFAGGVGAAQAPPPLEPAGAFYARGALAGAPPRAPALGAWP